MNIQVSNTTDIVFISHNLGSLTDAVTLRLTVSLVHLSLTGRTLGYHVSFLRVSLSQGMY